MILFLDTSALIKLFVAEQHSDAVRSAAGAAPAVTVSALTLVETHATFARMRVGRRLDDPGLRALVVAFERFWAGVAIVPVDPLVASATDLARRHALRGADAVQLASALEVAQADEPLFASFDAELEVAAAREGLALLPR